MSTWCLEVITSCIPTYTLDFSPANEPVYIHNKIYFNKYILFITIQNPESKSANLVLGIGKTTKIGYALNQYPISHT